jgi:hypothetical protein
MNVGMILRAPVSRRAWVEFAYVLVSAPLAALGFVYVVVTLALGAGLAVSAAGFPLLAAGLVGARRIGGLHRRLAGRFLGERIEAPERPAATPGPLGRMQTRLSDPVGWRTMGYLLLKFPVVALQVYVLTLTWVWGVVAATRPLQNALDFNQDAPGSTTARSCASAGWPCCSWRRGPCTWPRSPTACWRGGCSGGAGWKSAYGTWRRRGPAPSTTRRPRCAGSNATCTTAPRYG